MTAPLRHRCWAIALLLVGGAAGLGYHAAPAAAAGDVWNIGQASLALFLMAMLAVAYPGWPRRVLAVLACWQVLAGGCSLAWLVRPWTVSPGQGQCSALLDLPLTTLCAWLLAVLALQLDKAGRATRENDHDAP